MNVLTLPLSPDALARLESREAERADRLRQFRCADPELAAYAAVDWARGEQRKRRRFARLLDFGPEWAL